MLGSGDLTFQWVDEPDELLIQELTAGRPDRDALREGILRGRDRLVLLRSSTQNQLLGFLSFRYLSASQLFGALRDTELANRIRLRSAGTTLIITSAMADTSDPLKDYLQLLFTEVLAKALADDCIYGVYRPCGAPVSYTHLTLPTN